MAELQYTFKRVEKKYLLTPKQYESLFPALEKNMQEDRFGRYTICNIYYDTPYYDLIRTSLQKPVYKEKFRLRSYGVPGEDDRIFAEIKKKYSGIVYKRRTAGVPQQILALLENRIFLPADLQIQKEILYFLQVYRPTPKVFIGYDRTALAGREDADIRITFDRNIRFREKELDLRAGDFGTPLLPEEKIIMEVKVPHAIPLWLASLLSEKKIYPASFSKYGTCYKYHIAGRVFGRQTEKPNDFA